jgi:hypothetical protein
MELLWNVNGENPDIVDAWKFFSVHSTDIRKKGITFPPQNLQQNIRAG